MLKTKITTHRRLRPQIHNRLKSHYCAPHLLHRQSFSAFSQNDTNPIIELTIKPPRTRSSKKKEKVEIDSQNNINSLSTTTSPPIQHINIDNIPANPSRIPRFVQHSTTIDHVHITRQKTAKNSQVNLQTPSAFYEISLEPQINSEDPQLTSNKSDDSKKSIPITRLLSGRFSLKKKTSEERQREKMEEGERERAKIALQMEAERKSATQLLESQQRAMAQHRLKKASLQELSPSTRTGGIAVGAFKHKNDLGWWVANKLKIYTHYLHNIIDTEEQITQIRAKFSRIRKSVAAGELLDTVVYNSLVNEKNEILSQDDKIRIFAMIKREHEEKRGKNPRHYHQSHRRFTLYNLPPFMTTRHIYDLIASFAGLPEVYQITRNFVDNTATISLPPNMKRKEFFSALLRYKLNGLHIPSGAVEMMKYMNVKYINTDKSDEYCDDNDNCQNYGQSFKNVNSEIYSDINRYNSLEHIYFPGPIKSLPSTSRVLSGSQSHIEPSSNTTPPRYRYNTNKMLLLDETFTHPDASSLYSQYDVVRHRWTKKGLLIPSVIRITPNPTTCQNNTKSPGSYTIGLIPGRLGSEIGRHQHSPHVLTLSLSMNPYVAHHYPHMLLHEKYPIFTQSPPVQQHDKKKDKKNTPRGIFRDNDDNDNDNDNVDIPVEFITKRRPKRTSDKVSDFFRISNDENNFYGDDNDGDDYYCDGDDIASDYSDDIEHDQHPIHDIYQRLSKNGENGKISDEIRESNNDLNSNGSKPSQSPQVLSSIHSSDEIDFTDKGIKSNLIPKTSIQSNHIDISKNIDIYVIRELDLINKINTITPIKSLIQVPDKPWRFQLEVYSHNDYMRLKMYINQLNNHLVVNDDGTIQTTIIPFIANTRSPHQPLYAKLSSPQPIFPHEYHKNMIKKHLEIDSEAYQDLKDLPEWFNEEFFPPITDTNDEFYSFYQNYPHTTSNQQLIDHFTKLGFFGQKRAKKAILNNNTEGRCDEKSDTISAYLRELNYQDQKHQQDMLNTRHNNKAKELKNISHNRQFYKPIETNFNPLPAISSLTSLNSSKKQTNTTNKNNNDRVNRGNFYATVSGLHRGTQVNAQTVTYAISSNITSKSLKTKKSKSAGNTDYKSNDNVLNNNKNVINNGIFRDSINIAERQIYSYDKHGRIQVPVLALDSSDDEDMLAYVPIRSE